MVIHNFSKQYRVIREGAEKGDIHQYICREENEKKEYRIAKQDIKEVNGSEIHFFMEQLHNEAFRDFIDYFTDADSLYLVMTHPTGESLTKKLEESCSLKERMEIGKNILEHMVLLNLPAFFFKAAMKADLITVSRSLEISLGYDLSELGKFQEINFHEGCILLGQVFGEMYKEELSIRAFPPMEVFLSDLKNKKFTTILELYQRFQEIHAEWAEKKAEELKPKSFVFRLWEGIKSLLRIVRKLLTVAILLLAVAYLVFSLIQVFRVPDAAQNYSAIGTLKIEETEGGESLSSEEPKSVGE